MGVCSPLRFLHTHRHDGWALEYLWPCNIIKFNPYLTNGFSHHYHLGESTVIFRGVRSNFSILFNFSIKNL